MTVHTDALGYAAVVRCGLNHSGNHRLARSVNGFWQCQGCGQFFAEHRVAIAQEHPTAGEIGSGGLVRLPTVKGGGR